MGILRKFSDSAKELKDVRNLATIGLLLALYLVLSTFASFQVMPTMRVSTAFLAMAIIGMRFGPTVGALSGVAGDLLGYLIKGGGMFFPGYTLTALLSGIVWGLFLYKDKPTLPRTIFARTAINALLHCGLNTLWSSILYEKAYLGLFWTSVTKNAILLPFEILAVFLLTNGLLKILNRQKSSH